ncbi:Thymocyte nuclear protein 1, partial [Globomyces sp. JEL0801]
GLATIVKEGYVDCKLTNASANRLVTAFDKEHPYYDPKSLESSPKWYMVDVEFTRKLNRFISLKELQKHKTEQLKNMPLLNRGRLSVQPVDKESFDFIMDLEKLPVEP